MLTFLILSILIVPFLFLLVAARLQVGSVISSPSGLATQSFWHEYWPKGFSLTYYSCSVVSYYIMAFLHRKKKNKTKHLMHIDFYAGQLPHPLTKQLWSCVGSEEPEGSGRTDARTTAFSMYSSHHHPQTGSQLSTPNLVHGKWQRFLSSA